MLQQQGKSRFRLNLQTHSRGEINCIQINAQMTDNYFKFNLSFLMSCPFFDHLIKINLQIKKKKLSFLLKIFSLDPYKH